MKQRLYILGKYILFFCLIFGTKKTIVNAIETNGWVEFHGVYQSINEPDPPPNLKEPPDFDSPYRGNSLPQTDFTIQGHWIGIGLFVVIIALTMFVSKKIQKQMQN